MEDGVVKCGITYAHCLCLLFKTDLRAIQQNKKPISINYCVSS